MFDRYVRKLERAGTRLSEPASFSSFLDQSNIVLLGDPGAGKTHLFQTFAGPGQYCSARDLLNVPADRIDAATLFIDGLDEKRSGRGDSGSIDALVSKLFATKSEKVRIACRVADWLGSADLGAFAPYFDQRGGVILLVLQAMSEAETDSMLHALGWSDPSAFIAQANSRGLGDLLGNPQNLLMLSAAVRSSSWPTTRRDLYKSAVDILLTERNGAHSTKNTGTWSYDELILPAGAICAARLIGDVSGISLRNDGDELLPSYRSVTQYDPSLVLAALTRRAFRATGRPDTVDYTHRTVAEYLAANYLAHQIREGLPVNRVREILGIEGRPASELRGLHAWLAVMLPQCCEVLIDADPYGVLTYGDAASLMSPHRAYLLLALSRLAEDDPWFRHGDWSAETMRALAAVDMSEPFRSVLTQDSIPYSLLSVVLDAIALGVPMPALREELYRRFVDRRGSHHLRIRALSGLLKIGPSTYQDVLNAYRQISQDASSLPIRISTLTELLTLGMLGSKEIVELLNDAFRAPRSSVIYSGLSGFEREIPAGFERDILDGLDLSRYPKHGPDSQLARQAFDVMDALIVRLVKASPEPGYLVDKLENRAEAAVYRDMQGSSAIAASLREQPELLDKALHVVLERAREPSGWRCMISISRVFVGAADAHVLLGHLLPRLRSDPAAVDPRFYEMAILSAFRVGPARREDFEWLFGIAGREELVQVRASNCICEIEDWRRDEAVRRQTNLEKDADDIEKNRKSFDDHREAIVSGRHLGWLAYIGQLYLSLFSDTDPKASPRERLVRFLGEERADPALQGLLACVANGQASTLDEILLEHEQQKYWPWWYAVIAGITELFSLQGHLNNLSPAYVSSALTIDLLHPTAERTGSDGIRHAWIRWSAERSPTTVCEAYLSLAKFDMARGADFVHGFNEMMNLPQLASMRVDCAFELLAIRPTMAQHYLRDSLAVVLDGPDAGRISDLIHDGLCRSAHHWESYTSWMAAGVLADLFEFKRFADVFLARDAQRELAAAFAALYRKHKSTSVLVAEYLLRWVVRNSRRSDGLEESEENDNRSGWRETQFASALIEHLAADTSSQAQAALIRGASDPDASPFHEDFKHAAAVQMRRRLDEEYRQPGWREVLAVLRGGPPISIGDLHALVMSQLADIQRWIVYGNTDLFKRFWNEDEYGRLTEPKPENSCRHALIDLLRPRLEPLGIVVEPEAHMANSKRADIGLLFGNKMKLLLELKRHYHDEVWVAASDQLERFYSRDPQSQGFGIYCVLWFGTTIPVMRLPPDGQPRPTSAERMAEMIQRTIPANHRAKIASCVLDVSNDTQRGNL